MSIFDQILGGLSIGGNRGLFQFGLDRGQPYVSLNGSEGNFSIDTGNLIQPRAARTEEYLNPYDYAYQDPLPAPLPEAFYAPVAGAVPVAAPVAPGHVAPTAGPAGTTTPEALAEYLRTLSRQEAIMLQQALDSRGYGASTDPERYSAIDGVAGPLTTQGLFDLSQSDPALQALPPDQLVAAVQAGHTLQTAGQTQAQPASGGQTIASQIDASDLRDALRANVDQPEVMQRYLTSLGYGAGGQSEIMRNAETGQMITYSPIDGEIGYGTTAAYADFCRHNNINPNDLGAGLFALEQMAARQGAEVAEVGAARAPRLTTEERMRG